MIWRLWWGFCALVLNRGPLLHLLGVSGITIFVGPNGSGKSLLAVEAVLRSIEGPTWSCDDLNHVHNRPAAAHVDGCSECSTVRGSEHFCEVARHLLDEHGTGERLVWSTLPILDHRTGALHPRYRALTSIRQLVHIEHAEVLFDEVAGISDAEDSSSMPRALTRWLQQLRKRDVFLRVTTPAYDRCSKPIRQVANVVVDCRSFFPVKADGGRRWRPRRAVLAKGYDAFAFGSFDKNTGSRLPALATWFYWRGAHRAQRSYDTLAQVHALVHVSESGTCEVCNGSRSRPKCGCPPDVESIPMDEVAVIEEDGPRGGRQRRAVRIGQAGVGAGGAPGGGAGTDVAGPVDGLDPEPRDDHLDHVPAAAGSTA